MRLSDERIREIEAAEKAATAGSDGLGGLDVVHLQAERDAAKDLIVAAIPELLTGREGREREIERLEGAVNELDALVGSLRLEISSSATRAESLEKQLEAVKAWTLECTDSEGNVNPGYWDRLDYILDGKGDK